MSRIWNELTTPPASTHLPYTTLFRSLLRAGQGRSEDRQQRQQVGEHQAEVGDVTGGEVSHLVADHEAQRLGVAAVAAYLEHVGVDDHVASEKIGRASCRERGWSGVGDGEVKLEKARIDSGIVAL